MNPLVNSLSKGERKLVRDTKRAHIAGLDEDDLMQLHRRVRRARNKYAEVYRRTASAGVVEHGGRGAAGPKNLRNAGKAEVFEDALARVSRQLAVAARESAKELKAARLAMARQNGAGPAASTPRGTGKPAGSGQRAQRADKSPAGKKRDASTLAAGARRQAKRDSS